MATYVIGLILLVMMFFAGRHVYYNLRDGKDDCCGGCAGCSACASKAGMTNSSGCCGCK